SAVQLGDWIYTIGNNIYVFQYEIFRTQLSSSRIVLSPSAVDDLVPDDVISFGAPLVLGHTLVIPGSGQDNGNLYGDTIRYPLGSTGKLGPFAAAGALPAHGGGAAAVVLGASLYLVGGGTGVL